MRIASTMLYDQLARGLKNQLSKLNDLSNQLATGKKIARPSDDVQGTVRVMDYKLSINLNEQYQRNLTAAEGSLEFQNTVLSQVSDTLGSLKELISDGGNASGTAEDRANYAGLAAKLRDFLLDLSNSKNNDRYIYSGFQSNQKAYEYDAVNHVYAYQGDSGQIKLPIDKGMDLITNFVGSSDDSTISTAFSYTLQAPETTTLADGSEVTYTSVSDPVLGVTTIEVAITHPDHPGDPDYEDSFSFSNFMEMANILTHAWQYQDVDGSALSEPKAMNRIAALAIPLEKAQKQVLTVQSEVGIRQTNLKDQTTRLDANTVSLQNAQSRIEDADLNETAIELQKISTALEALRISSSKILSQSLFDFLT